MSFDATTEPAISLGNELGQAIWRAHGQRPQEQWRRWVLRVGGQVGEGNS